MSDPMKNLDEDLTPEEATRLGMNNATGGLVAARTTPAEAQHYEAKWRRQQSRANLQQAEANAAAGDASYPGGERQMRVDGQILGNQTLSHTAEAKAARVRQRYHADRLSAAQELERRRNEHERAESSVRISGDTLRRERHAQAVKAKQAELDAAIAAHRSGSEIADLAAELNTLQEQS